MGSPDGNKAVVRRLVEDLFNTGELRIADEVLAEGYVDHSASYPGVPGPENIKLAVSGWLAAFPDTVSSVRDLIAEDDKVAARWTTRATHRGEYMGVRPTGSEVEVTWYGVFRVAEGKIVESWDTCNVVELMQQLGRPL